MKTGLRCQIVAGKGLKSGLRALQSLAKSRLKGLHPQQLCCHFWGPVTHVFFFLVGVRFSWTLMVPKIMTHIPLIRLKG